MRQMLQALWNALQRICITVDKSVALIENEVDLVSEEQRYRLEEERQKRPALVSPDSYN